MEVSGSRRIPAPREVVWSALDDLATLKACIPGCERLERVSDDAFEGLVATKIGPIRAEFACVASRSEAAEPEGFTLRGEGQGGAAGSFSGSARISLAQEGDGTLVSYVAEGEVVGKVGQLGSRLVGGFARKSAADLFAMIEQRIASGAVVAARPASADAPPLVHEEPAETSADVVDAPPPLAAGSIDPLVFENAIAPTAAPEVPDIVSIAAAETVPTEGASAVTRIMLIAAIVVVVGALVYYMVWQAPH